MEDKLKALHLIFNDSPIYAIDEDVSTTSSTTTTEASSNLQVGFVSTYASKEAISENELTFLRKIFTAAKLDESTIDFTNTLENKTYAQVIGMGVNPFELGIQDATFPFYDLKTHNNTAYLFADDIATIMNDNDKKGGLWAGLKRMFGV